MVRTVEWPENGRKIHIVRSQSEIPADHVEDDHRLGILDTFFYDNSGALRPGETLSCLELGGYVEDQRESEGFVLPCDRVVVQVGPTLVKELSF
jgi:hypothetical protein